MRILSFLFFKDFIYFFMSWVGGRAETQAEGEAGSMQAALRETQSWVSRITPWTKGSAQPLSHPGLPHLHFKDEETEVCGGRDLLWDT